jgi:hypothetical protein
MGGELPFQYPNGWRCILKRQSSPYKEVKRVYIKGEVL